MHNFFCDFIVLIQVQVYSICLTLFFDLYELFPAFICANNKKEWLKERGLVNSFFGIKVSISVSVFFAILVSLFQQ